MLILLLIIMTSVAVLLACAGVFWFFSSQLKKNDRLLREESKLEERSSWGNCARCGQHRVIINKDAGLCAFCWSSMRTKQSG